MHFLFWFKYIITPSSDRNNTSLGIDGPPHLSSPSSFGKLCYACFDSLYIIASTTNATIIILLLVPV